MRAYCVPRAIFSTGGKIYEMPILMRFDKSRHMISYNDISAIMKHKTGKEGKTRVASEW
jgi:hypothetical protein